MMSKHEFDCADCGEHKVHDNPQDYGGTGYGADADGNKICYDCCGKRDVADMKASGRAVLYLVKKEGRLVVTNWPGTLSFQVIHRSIGRHNIAGTRDDVWFKGPNGCTWWGVCYGSNTQLCHCRRLKAA